MSLEYANDFNRSNLNLFCYLPIPRPIHISIWNTKLIRSENADWYMWMCTLLNLNDIVATDVKLYKKIIWVLYWFQPPQVFPAFYKHLNERKICVLGLPNKFSCFINFTLQFKSEDIYRFKFHAINS